MNTTLTLLVELWLNLQYILIIYLNTMHNLIFYTYLLIIELDLIMKQLKILFYGVKNEISLVNTCGAISLFWRVC